MPYLEQGIRESLDQGRKATKPGELHYLISTLCNDYLATRGISYTSLNEVHGVLACAQLEIFRVITGPYEELKRANNGEIWTILNLKA